MNTTTDTASNLSEKAPAKINLQLKVIARRPDGYHELQLSFLPLRELYDVIELEFSPGRLEVYCPGADIPEHGGNLCGKAAYAYHRATDIPPEWVFTVRKNIPVAAGLGGGSSDAAAVLRLLNRHYRALPARELAALAAGLGADVPFFLDPRPANATGIGEKLTPFDFELPELPLLLVSPDFPVSAAWAYQRLEPERIGPGAPFRGGTLHEIAGQMQNDLEPAVLAKFPLLRLIRQAMLEEGGAAALMSGSGPAMFALCPDAARLARMRRRFELQFPSCRIFPFIFPG